MDYYWCVSLPRAKVYKLLIFGSLWVGHDDLGGC